MFPRGSLFSSVFDNDPFFRDPFAQMNNMMRSMINDPFMGHMHTQMFPQTMIQQVPLPPPVVEEVSEDHSGPQRAGSDPIVEEPDEDHAEAGHTARTPQPQQRPAAAPAQPQFPQFPTFSALPGMQSSAISTGGSTGTFYSFSSSSTFTSSGGPNGITYSSTTTSRMGPGQVHEVQRVVRDGRTGQESVTISRGLQDKARTITRTRDASGAEMTQEQLRGLSEAEAAAFDQQWRSQAERSLPQWGNTHRPQLSTQHQSRQRPTLALPSSGRGGSHHGDGSAGYQQGYYGHNGY